MVRDSEDVVYNMELPKGRVIVSETYRVDGEEAEKRSALGGLTEFVRTLTNHGIYGPRQGRDFYNRIGVPGLQIVSRSGRDPTTGAEYVQWAAIEART